MSYLYQVRPRQSSDVETYLNQTIHNVSISSELPVGPYEGKKIIDDLGEKNQKNFPDLIGKKNRIFLSQY